MHSWQTTEMVMYSVRVAQDVAIKHIHTVNQEAGKQKRLHTVSNELHICWCQIPAVQNRGWHALLLNELTTLCMSSRTQPSVLKDTAEDNAHKSPSMPEGVGMYLRTNRPSIPRCCRNPHCPNSSEPTLGQCARAHP